MNTDSLFLSTAVQAAKASGAILKNGFYTDQIVQGKAEHDVVSQVDFDSEKLILEIISSTLPDHSIHAEESGTRDKDSAYKWYIDPLDGTSNFLLGIPYFSVSIALAYQGDIIVGVIYNPIVDELYIAQKDKGATRNNQPIQVSSQNSLPSALIASAYSADERDIRRGLKTVEGLALHSRKVVINFSPALDLCNIARGKLDALVDNGTTSEDHAAGSLILTEAGGTVQNYQDKNWDVEIVGIIASNGVLQHKVRTYAQ
jgi:myo-inositol-1(or 4)-monophosphatase